MEENNEIRKVNVKKKPRGKPFEKGNKLGGRKPISAEVKELLGSVTIEAIEKKIELMRDPSTKARLLNTIIEELLDRSLGKAIQSVDIESNNNHEVRVVLEDKLKEWAK